MEKKNLHEAKQVKHIFLHSREQEKHKKTPQNKRLITGMLSLRNLLPTSN